MADPPTDYAALYAEVAEITETLFTGGYDGTEGNEGSPDATFTDFGIVCGGFDRLKARVASLEAELAEAEKRAVAAEWVADERAKDWHAERSAFHAALERAVRAETALRELREAASALEDAIMDAIAGADLEAWNAPYRIDVTPLTAPRDRLRAALAVSSASEAETGSEDESADGSGRKSGAGSTLGGDSRLVELPAGVAASDPVSAFESASEAETERAAATESHAGSMVKPPRSVSASEPTCVCGHREDRHGRVGGCSDLCRCSSFRPDTGYPWLQINHARGLILAGKSEDAAEALYDLLAASGLSASGEAEQ